ncbi:MAG: phytanoyl-CoA dioxygenase family protein [Crocinitomicaceae bacterium]|nr:phytanoyl-CoA dioxygenase family protein [Crocinitomicaceae bacterium]
MRPLFKNSELQAKFESDGFVKLSLLEKSEVDYLLSYYKSCNFDNKIEAGFHISLDNLNQELVTEVGEEIKKVLVPKTVDIFDRGQVFTASYVVKEPGLQNIVPPHQDWSFVDESEFCSVTVWTPLVDVTQENGALGVIKGSHKLFNHHRSSPSPQSKSPLADHIFTLFPFVEIVEMKAGETLIFNNRLIHASPPNLTKEPRIAVGIGITQEEAKLRHYYHIPKSEPAQLEVYEVEKEFYTWYNNARLSSFYDKGERPTDLTKIDTIEREVPELSKSEMEDLVNTLDNVSINHELMRKLAELFGYEVDANGIIKKNKTTEESALASKPTDGRSFFQKYTLGNIWRELAWRMNGRK